MTRARATKAARAGGFLLAVGLSFGFIMVAAIAWASWFRLPDGVAPRDYATLGSRGADSGLFGFVSSTDYERLRDSTTGITWAFADYFRNQVDVRIADGTTVAVQSRRVSVNFFDLLGVRATIGVLGSENARGAVVTEAFARKAYGAAAEALGREVPDYLDRPVPILGVADSAFRGVFDEEVDVWILDPPGPAISTAPDGSVSTIVSIALVPLGALDGATNFATAQAMLDGFRFTPGRGDYGSATERDRAELVAGIERRPDARRDVLERLSWLALVVVLLLALAFVAVLDFLLAAHYRREESDAVRLAIGATPGDVFRASLLPAAAWMAATAAVAAVSFLYIADVVLGLDPFAAFLGELTTQQSMAGVGASVALLGAAFLLSAAVVSRFVSRTGHVISQAQGRTAAPAWRTARRALLLVAATSLLLVASLGLRYATDARATLPFEHVGTTMLSVVSTAFESVTPEEVRRTLLANPQVASIARLEMMPLLAESIRPQNRVKVRGALGLEDTVFLRNGVSPSFFETLGVGVVAGRTFDGGASSEVAISRTAAKLLADEAENAVGMALDLVPASPGSASPRAVTVVGVVDDVPYGPVTGTDAQGVLYGLAGPADWQQLWLVRHDGSDEEILEPFGDDGYRIGTPAEIFRERFLSRHSIEVALAAAAAFAVILALAGVATSVAREVAAAGRGIGIRLALGASGVDLAARHLGGILVNLLGATLAVCVAVLLARGLAPGLVDAIELLLVFAALPVLAVACAAVVLGSVLLLARNRSLSSLIGGAHG
ncbi:MAG: hypothetical protein OXG82_08045 [Gammaproteobacteria bacterium]|nr:hypothetical protein [Gammaproteobacteria bacterium]